MRTGFLKLVLLVVLAPWLSGSVAAQRDFQPDPAAVERFGPAYRYPQAGWLVLHVEGDPYDRGVQHGRLMAKEIEGHLKSFALMYSPKAPADSWRFLRLLTESLFLRGFEREYLEEMRGIADGAAAAGAKFDGRPLDLTDIAAVNLWPEIMCLEWGAAAVPTGLEGVKFPGGRAKPTLPPKPGHCSAFAATGPATGDGKIVFGHITMFGLYPSTFYNLWLDVQPKEGHRVLMQSFPGGIHSGMDYYLNSAGILVLETTLDQTRFNVAGVPLASRIRRAVQYSDTIDEVVETLKSANNGLYTNEWLLADVKTNEIAMFELGTASSKLYRSSKGEWFGGTEGFYWGCNNAKDMAVRLETIAGTNDRPFNAVWEPSIRDQKWIELYAKYKGKIGEAFGKEAFTTPPICAFASVDAKFTTSAMARDLKTWAIFGPPRGKTWRPTFNERRDFPEIEPLVSNPWTILHGQAPTISDGAITPVDLGDEMVSKGSGKDVELGKDEPILPSDSIAWRGTILPKSDADAWLAAAFADHHGIVARDRGHVLSSESGCLCEPDLSKSGASLFAARSAYLAAVAAVGDTALSDIRLSTASSESHRIAAGKGLLLLGELRRRLGDEPYVEVMDSFGVAHAGQKVSWKDFASHAEKIAGADLRAFFDYWTGKTGLPRLKLQNATMATEETPSSGASRRIQGVLVAEIGPLPTNVEVTVEMDGKETTSVVPVDPKDGSFSVDADKPPIRLIVDKYSRVARANGGSYDLTAFGREFERTLIVYGTLDDEAGNREAADVLAEAIRKAYTNVDTPVRSDAVVTDDELKDHHLLLIGRPATNRVTQQMQSAFSVSFGLQSFTVAGETYAHYKSAVLAAGANLLNPRYSAKVIAGLSALATYQAASKLEYSGSGAEVEVLPYGGTPRRLVVPSAELVWKFSEAESQAEAGTR